MKGAYHFLFLFSSSTTLNGLVPVFVPVVLDTAGVSVPRRDGAVERGA